MAISDTIQSMYENVGEVYDTITNVSLPEHKNIENIPSTIRDSYLEIMNNGIDVVWDNWEKVVGEGTELTLSNTEQAPMKVLLKGNTYQDSTTGANLQKFDTRTSSTYGYTCDDKGQVIITGTTSANAGLGYNLQSTNPMTLEAGTYTLKVIGTIDSNVSIQTMGTARTLNTNQEYQFTLTETINNFYAGSYVRAGTHNSSYYITLAKGTTATTERYTNGASPNPDYPQEVHTVSGDNEVEVCGKNLQSGEQLYQRMYAHNSSKVSKTTDGTVEAIRFNSRYYRPTGVEQTFNCYNKWKENTRYTIRFLAKKITGNVLYIQIIYTDGTTSQFNVPGSTEKYNQIRLVSTEGKTIERAGFSFGTEGEWLLDMSSWYIGEGNITEYPEYKGTTYPINLPEGMFLGSIGDYKDRFFKTSGKNLANPLLESGSINTTTGEDTPTVGTVRTKGYIYIGNNTPIYFKRTGDTTNLKARWYDENKNYIGSDPAIGSNLTKQLTPPTNARYFRIAIDGNYPNYFTDYQVMLSTTDIPYEPYGTNEWYLEKKIGKLVLNGTETTPDINTTKTNTTRLFYYNLGNILTEGGVVGTGLCNRLPINSNSFSNDVEGISCGNGANNKKVFLRINKSTIGTTAQEVSTWLGNNNIIFYYCLDTPTYTKIEGILASQLEEVYRAKSEEGQTNISQTNYDLPFVLSVSALKEIN